jgi:hypothetical protein
MTGKVEGSAGRPRAGLDPDAFTRANALAEGYRPTGAFDKDGAVVCHGGHIPE